MEPYITLCYVIKNGDTGLFWYIIREVYIIFQALTTFKPKYARVMLRQLHIIDIKAAALIFQKTYLANAFLNLK